MKIIKDNACMIDMIAKEAALRQMAKLKKAKVKTFPYVSTARDNRSGETRGHCGLIFHYKGDTYNYENGTGTTRIYRKEKSVKYVEIVKKAYRLQPHLTVLSAMPLDMAVQFPEESQPLPPQYVNWEAFPSKIT